MSAVVGASDPGSTSPTRGAAPRPSRDRLIQYALAAIVVLLIATALLPVLYQSVLAAPIYDLTRHFTLGNYLRFAESRELHQAIGNSFILATISTLVGTAIGALFAVLVARTNLPGRRFASGAMLLPLYVSHLILSVGWFIMYGPAGYITELMQNSVGFVPWNLYSLVGMSVLAGVSSAPLTFILCIGSLRLLDPSMEDAARSVGARPSGSSGR